MRQITIVLPNFGCSLGATGTEAVELVDSVEAILPLFQFIYLLELPFHWPFKPMVAGSTPVAPTGITRKFPLFEFSGG